MEREKLEGLLIDFIDGRLNEGERKEVRELLNNDSEARTLYEQFKQVTSVMDRSSELSPSDKLYGPFQQMLNEEATKEHKPQQRQVFFTPMLFRAAAAVALVMIGVTIGFYVNKYNTQQEELVKAKEEAARLKQEMLASMQDQHSASTRMVSVNSIAQNYPEADKDVVEALVKVLNEDKNTNVRLAALEALSHFHQQANVRKELISALEKQDDPIVQIALIQLMVKMNEKGALKDLNRIVEDENVIKPVKDEAYSGILKLS